MTNFTHACRSARHDINRRPTECAVLPLATCGVLPLAKYGVLPLAKCGVLPLAKCGVLPLAKCGVLPLAKCGVLPLAKYNRNNCSPIRVVTIFRYNCASNTLFCPFWVSIFIFLACSFSHSHKFYLHIDFVCLDITDLLTALQILIRFSSVWLGLNLPLQGVQVATSRARLYSARLWIQNYVQSFSLRRAGNGTDCTTEYITGRRQFLAVDYLYYSEKKGKIWMVI
jgi:hypothetical protein